MIRNAVLALLLLAAGGAEAAVTLPLRGEVRATSTGDLLATIGGSVGFDANALVAEGDYTPVEELRLKIDFADVLGLPPGRYVVTETDPRLDDTPQVWRFADRYELEVSATAEFADVTYTILASPFDAGLVVFDAGFTSVAEGSLEVVPLPAALPLLASGLGLLAWARRRRAG